MSVYGALQNSLSKYGLVVTFLRIRSKASCGAMCLALFATSIPPVHAVTDRSPLLASEGGEDSMLPIAQQQQQQLDELPQPLIEKNPDTNLNLRPNPNFSSAELYNDLYELGPGDGLSLTFLDPAAESIGGPFTILLDGTANLPLLGSVQLTGLTISQANSWLTSLYSKMVNRPDLYLTLVSPRAKRITILGEVGRPGLYPLPTLATSFDAIVQAGGITLHADIRNVLLRRRTGGQGQQKQTVLNLSQLMQYGNQLQNPILLDGDTIVVGRTEEPNPEEVMQLSASNISPQTISVFVLGAVNNPGGVSVPANTPLDDVILRAGGVRELTANQRNIELVRLNRNGTRSLEVLNLNKQSGVSNTLNPPLRDGDTVIVRSNLYGKALLVLNQFVFPVINTGTTLLNTYNIWDDYRFRFQNDGRRR